MKELSDIEKLKLMDELNHLHQLYPNKKCLFPDKCNNAPIDSHTVQKAKLKYISENEQVYKQ